MPIGGYIKKIFGTSHEREIKRLRPRVERINAMEPAWQKLTDAELRGKTAEFRQKLDNGATLDDILPEAFAACARRAGACSACATSTCSSSAAWCCTAAPSPR